MDAVNDPTLSADERLAALAAVVETAEFPEFVGESNNHVHTIYSFSPYTPAAAALRARQAGLAVVGSVDHDSIAAADEMRRAATMLGMGVVTGFEIRVVADGEFADRKLNNPDSTGIFYMTVQGVPERSRAAAEEFLRPVREARLARTARMVEKANAILAEIGAQPITMDADVTARSQYHKGGTVTERHLLAALASRLIDHFGRGEALVDGLARIGVEVSAALADPANPYADYDLLGVLKAGFLERIYEQPTRIADGGECYDASEVVAFATTIGAVPCYAYLGDVTASPTGDKAAEKFEDEFLEELFDYLVRAGFPAVTYMPPRNTPEQLDRIARLAAERGLLEVSGVDINTPRQSFNCPELQRDEFAHLNDATWALVAHEVLADADPSLGLFTVAEPLTPEQLKTRVSVKYAPLGRALAAGDDVAAVVKAAQCPCSCGACTTEYLKARTT